VVLEAVELRGGVNKTVTSTLSYDYLLVAVGAEPNTFGIPVSLGQVGVVVVVVVVVVI